MQSQNPVEQFINSKRDPRAEEIRRMIITMMSDPFTYGFAEDMLTSILEFIDVHGYVSDKQAAAVENIKNSR